MQPGCLHCQLLVLVYHHYWHREVMRADSPVDDVNASMLVALWPED